MAGSPQPKRSTYPAAGDVVVIKVATHYHIGRVRADRQPIAAIALLQDRADALALACRVVKGRQRVFLYGNAGSADCVEIARADRGRSAAVAHGTSALEST